MSDVWCQTSDVSCHMSDVWHLWSNVWRLMSDVWCQGRFPFSKNSGLKFRKFHVPNGTVHSGCTDPTQATARLVIVLGSRIQKSGTGNNNFVKWKGTFRSDRPKWPDQSLWTTFKAGPEYSGQTKPKLSVPFDVLTKVSGILGWMKSAPDVRCLIYDVWSMMLDVCCLVCDVLSLIYDVWCMM